MSIISSFEEPEMQEEAAAVLDLRTDNEIEADESEKLINECVIRIKTNSIDKQMESEQDLSRMVELKRAAEKIQKIDIFGRSI